MPNIATLGFSAQTADLKTATADLRALKPAAESAAAGVDTFNAAAAGITGATGGASAGIKSFNAAAMGAGSSTGTLSKAALSAGTAMGTVQRAAAGANTQFNLLGNTVGRVGLNFVQADAHVEAYKTHLLALPAAANNAGSALNRLGKSANDNISRLQATPGNIAAQFQDIGVTAAAGMSPMLIALQQGTQLSAAFAGGGLSQLGAAIKQLLSPTTLLTIAFVALVAILIQWAMEALSASSAADKLAKDLDKGTKAADFFGEAQSNVAKIFDTATGKLKSHNDVLAQYIKLQAQANILAAQAARMDATKAVANAAKPTIWNQIKAYSSIPDTGDYTSITEMRQSVAPLQSVLGTFSTTVNATNLTIDGLNKATDTAISNIDRLAKSHRLANHDIIATKKAVLDLATARGQEFANADVVTSINQGHLTSSLITPKKPHKKGGKTDAQKFQDIVEGAQNDIATQNAAAAAVNLTAQAAASLEEKTKLLNQAHTQEIKLTAPMIAQINQLADAYGLAKVEAERLKIAQDLTNATDAELSNLKQQGELIGKYGKELAFATEYAKEYAAAKAKFGNDKEGLMFFSTTHITASAGAIADQSIQNDTKRFMADVLQAREKDIASLKSQQGELGLTGVALAAYRYEQSLLNDAAAKHIELSEMDRLQIHKDAAAYAALTDTITKQIEKITFFRDTYRSFFDTMISGLREGQSVWKAFGNAVMSVVNKIIDRLLNMQGGVLDKLVGLGGKLLGIAAPSQVSPALAAQFDSVIPSAKGNAFAQGGVQAFAKGGAFTNGVYDTPTLFKFAKGAAMGQMGEAGPEAVMPLKRGPDGSLGVQINGSQPIRVIVDTNDDRFNAYVDERSDGRIATHAPAIANAGSTIAQRTSAFKQSRRLK